MLPVHVQNLFGGNVIRYNGKLYTVIEVSRNVRQPHQYWLKTRGINDRDLLEVLLPEDFIVMKLVTEPALISIRKIPATNSIPPTPLIKGGKGGSLIPKFKGNDIRYKAS